jgi:polyribonucleotide nucleotidyltransferase
MLTAKIEVGEIYRGTVKSVKDFGAFVEALPGKEGLVHISELADFRVKKTEDVAKLGDEIWVKCIGIDDKGRVKLSRKAAMAEREAESGNSEASSDEEES